LVVSCVALAASLGGVGYAAVNMPANSVGTRQLRASAVTAAKLHANSVNSRKVRDDSLTGADVLEASFAKVPAAAAADNAGRADSATHASSADSAADSAKLGGLAASNYLVKLWAHVANTTISRGNGAVGIVRFYTGYYRITFDRDVRQCAPLATVSQDNGVYTNVGEIEALIVTGVPGSTNLVDVITSFADGTRVNRDFNVALFC
jgi:hypothetical protein